MIYGAPDPEYDRGRRRDLKSRRRPRCVWRSALKFQLAHELVVQAARPLRRRFMRRLFLLPLRPRRIPSSFWLLRQSSSLAALLACFASVFWASDAFWPPRRPKAIGAVIIANGQAAAEHIFQHGETPRVVHAAMANACCDRHQSQTADVGEPTIVQSREEAEPETEAMPQAAHGEGCQDCQDEAQSRKATANQARQRSARPTGRSICIIGRRRMAGRSRSCSRNAGCPTR